MAKSHNRVSQTNGKSHNGSRMRRVTMAGRPKIKTGVESMQNPMNHRIAQYLRVFSSVTNGADGKVIGLNGSVNATSAEQILNQLEADGNVVLDFGAGEGRFLVAAICAGARAAVGVEFPENTGYKLVLDAVVYRIALKYNIILEPHWIGQDIDEVRFPRYDLIFFGLLSSKRMKSMFFADD